MLTDALKWWPTMCYRVAMKMPPTWLEMGFRDRDV